MSLVRPAFKELERFTFFVSRRREDGRERFRLHMGYFASRTEAEQLLTIVRTVYPGAWVSEAPGKKLRNGSSPSGAAPAADLPPAPDLAAEAQPLALAPEPNKSAETGLHRMPAIEDPNSTSMSGLAPVITPVQAPSVPEPPVLAAARVATARPNMAPAPASTPAPEARAAAPQPQAQLSLEPKPAPKPAEPPAADKDAKVSDLSDSQVMRILERGPASAPEGATEYSDVPMLNKLDAHSLQALRKDLSKNLPVPFAVQLEWSPTPIDIRKIPPLAIFRAYTLYTVGCQFEGRRWFGLRLGFFSDVLSAKQVAQYVRAEFKSVAVVPVSNRERSQADATGGIDVEKTSPVRHNGSGSGEEITLLSDADRAGRPAASAAAVPAAKPAGKPPAANNMAKPATSQGRPAAQAPAAPVPAAARVLPRGAARSGANRTLEETLEILGASQLSIDNGKGERVNIPGRRAGGNAKTSTFSKLLDRLADRLKT